METKTGSCPLGAKCQEIKKDALVVCPWYSKLRGKDPQGDGEIDESRCAIGWLPILLVENSQFARQAGAAIESFRNEMVEQNDLLLNLQKSDTLNGGN